MKLSIRQWLLLLAFQLAYGAVVSLVTRAYHPCEQPAPVAQSRAPAPATAVRPDSPAAESLRRFGLLPEPGTSGAPAASPAASTLEGLLDLGNSYFTAGQYQAAASTYSQALGLDPSSAEVRNNLGITLHYLGRSAEALVTLREGVAKDPAHQRSWLTIGFVSLQLGDTARAREALQKAVALGPDSAVGKEAQRLLGQAAPPDK